MIAMADLGLKLLSMTPKQVQQHVHTLNKDLPYWLYFEKSLLPLILR